MKISNTYPYPVLHEANDDYRNSSFAITYDVNQVFGNVHITVMCDLQNDGIKELLNAGDATYLVHIECPVTSFRRAYKDSENMITIKIPADQLRGKLQIHTFIVANKSISHYRNRQLNDWFMDMDISFDKGNFLAIGNAIEVNLFEDNRELLNLPSIVNIQRSVKGEWMEVDMYTSNITISLPAYEYDQYAAHANSILKQSILSLVILPALIEVFSRIQDNSDELQEYTWYQVLEKIFTESGYDLAEIGTDRLPALTAAQMILRNPLKMSFEEIEKMTRFEE